MTGQNVMVPFNQLQGIASTNVPAYSNGADDFVSFEQYYFHGIPTGFKWQCVEFARRWLLIHKSCIFRDIGAAADIWEEITHIERITDGQHFSLKAHRNGSPDPPKSDTLLIYPRGKGIPAGHVAIICEVVQDFVRVTEQNYAFHYWPNNYSRQLRLIFKNGLYYIEDDYYEIYGWMEIEDNNQLEPFDESKIDAILPQYQKPKPTGKLQHCFTPDTALDTDRCWLNKNDPAENFFMELFGEDITRTKNTENLVYYTADIDLFLNIGNTSNELYRMFIDATNKVIHDDRLLEHFRIPNAFWPHIRESWANERDSVMLGRFNLAFDDRKLKAFEYNTDKASALFQCAIIAEKWAKAVNLDSSFMSGFQLHRVLVRNWKNSSIKTRVHLLIGNDPDERLTALYLKNVLNEAGIDSKLCTMTTDLYWKDSTIVDDDNQIVSIVWKSCKWDGVFEDYEEVQKERCQIQKNNDKSEDNWKPVNGEHPCLSDILLNNRIRVIEPLWTVITSHKALLSVLWSMFPNHSNLLDCELFLYDGEKQATAVNGDSVNGEITGNCSNHQEVFPSKDDDHHYKFITSWIIHGLFAGFGICEDQKLNNNNDNPVLTACCIV